VVDKRNATASWSGYLHQGQVGILVALREVNRLLSKGNSINDWSVIFENAEDFDIKNDEEVFSRHQVKAYQNAKFPNDVKDVLNTQVYINHELKTKGFQFKKLDPVSGTLTEVEVKDDSRFLHVITEIKGFHLNEKDFNKKYPKPNWICNLHNIKLYKYADGLLYCPLITEGNSTLEDYCLQEIKKYLESINHVEAQIELYQKKIYYSLVNKLDYEIKKRHIDKTHPKISFKFIENILKNNPDEQAYLISTYKRTVLKFVNEYISELNEILEDSGGLDDNIINRLTKYFSEIFCLDNSSFLQFLRDINPNELISSENIPLPDSFSIIKKDNFKNVFLECLYSISESKYEVQDRGYEEDGGYILSLIVDPKIKVGLLKRKIGANSMLTESLFSKSYLINKEISEPVNIMTNNQVVSLNWGTKPKLSDNVNKSGMRLINVNDAVIELNKIRE
jgi:hypothetical protein